MALYVIPRRVAWNDTVPGRVEALATMSLMQMIADAYEDAYDMCKDDTESNPSPSPRNEAQEAVRVWLADAQFLPPFNPRKHLPSLDQLSMLTEESSLTLSNPPNAPSRKWGISVGSLKLPRKCSYSGSMNSLSPSRSLLSLCPSKLWRRRREATASFITVSESSTLSTPPSTPSALSSRSLPTPIYKKRPRFPTKISYNALESVFHPLQDTRRSRTLRFDGTTSGPWLARSFSSPFLDSSSSSFEWSRKKPSVLDKDLSEDRPPDVTLLTLVVITILAYLFFLFLFVGCFLISISKFFGTFDGTTDE